MKKILLSFVSIAFVGLSQLSVADDLLAWAQYGTGVWVAPGCQWNAGGATPSGPVYSLSCTGITGGSATRSSNLPAPEVIGAGGTFYVLPKAGGPGTPINGYNYAIYRSTTPAACASRGTTIGTYTTLQAASANRVADKSKCGTNCEANIFLSGSQYRNVCH